MSVSSYAVLLVSVATTYAASAEPRKLISLADGITPLVSRFNDQKDRPQVVAILSPT